MLVIQHITTLYRRIKHLSPSINVCQTKIFRDLRVFQLLFFFFGYFDMILSTVKTIKPATAKVSFQKLKELNATPGSWVKILTEPTKVLDRVRSNNILILTFIGPFLFNMAK